MVLLVLLTGCGVPPVSGGPPPPGPGWGSWVIWFVVFCLIIMAVLFFVGLLDFRVRGGVGGDSLDQGEDLKTKVEELEKRVAYLERLLRNMEKKEDER